MDFDHTAKYVHGARNHHELDVAMRAKNGGVSFGIAAFLLTFAKPNFPSSPSEAAIHTSCSIGQYGLVAGIRRTKREGPQMAFMIGQGGMLTSDSRKRAYVKFNALASSLISKGRRLITLNLASREICSG